MWAFDFLQQLVPVGLREMSELRLDVPVLVYTLAVSLLAGIFFGLAPALQASKSDLNEALKHGGRAGTGAAQRRLRNFFVVAQVALSLMLWWARATHPDALPPARTVFGAAARERPDRADAARQQTATAARAARGLYDAVLARVKTIPRRGRGYTTAVPLVWKGGPPASRSKGASRGGRGFNANHRQVSPDYFRAIGLALRKAGLGEQDDERAQAVAAVKRRWRAPSGRARRPGQRFRSAGWSSRPPG